MNTDCAFYIGTTHEVCHDYTLSGKDKIILSDGCSGSRLSDMGSRVLSITAINKIAEVDDLHNFEPGECILLSRPSIKILNLPNTCLDATLLGAAGEEDCLQAFCYGDGTIALKTKNGDIAIIDIVYTDNHPFYINYLYDKTGRFTNWEQNHNKRKVTLSIIKKDGEIKLIKDNCDYPNIVNSVTRIPMNGGVDIGLVTVSPDRTFVQIVNDKIDDEIEWIAIMSDGVHSFYKPAITETSKKNEPVPYLEVLKSLLNFKNYNGKFVQRRINRFLKDCKKADWHNADDVSLAVIHCG
ncbi:MAG: hypothetical protein ACTSSP_01805 [Candidatus Asgardarchaeia archaeon]